MEGSPEDLVRDGDLSVRRMRDADDDYRRMLSWRREPHVREIWDDDDQPEHSLENVRAEYGLDTRPGSETTAAFIELEHRPIGYIEFYPWAAYGEAAREMSIPPDQGAWGLDIFIGDPDAIGLGYGSRVVDLVCRYLFDTRGATRVALLTAMDNLRAQHAYERAGLRKVARALDTDVRGGVRVECWLMVRDAPS